MRPIFCGNFGFDARQSELERLFKRYGKVDRVDMKSGFAFVYMDDERDAEYAIRALDRTEFGRKARRLRVEWTKQERGPRRPVPSRRSANLRPSKTLFVINFPYDTRTRDLERHFDPYGKLVNVRIRKNFAFVQYESQEDATKALDATNMSKMMDRVISVEYAAREDDDKRNEYGPDRREGDRSPGRRRRSPSPYRRERGSPDYGHGSSPAPFRRERDSPDNRHGHSASPYPRGRNSPDYGGANVRKSSPHGKERVNSNYHDRNYRDRSRTPQREMRASPDFPTRSESPRREQRAYPDYPDRSPPLREVMTSPDYPVHGQSPHEGERDSSKYPGGGSISPSHEQKASPDYPVNGNGPHLEQGAAHDYSDHSPSPRGEVKVSTDYGDGTGSPDPEENAHNGYDHPRTGSYEREDNDDDHGVAQNSKPDSWGSPEYEEEGD
ncbi:hypothetical protein Dimus_028275 [Dionaea muscipula]